MHAAMTPGGLYCRLRPSVSRTTHAAATLDSVCTSCSRETMNTVCQTNTSFSLGRVDDATTVDDAPFAGDWLLSLGSVSRASQPVKKK